MEESKKEEGPTASWGQVIGQRKTTQREKKKVKTNKNPSGGQKGHSKTPGVKPLCVPPPSSPPTKSKPPGSRI